jgi:Ribose 5-phosphate isomerase
MSGGNWSASADDPEYRSSFTTDNGNIILDVHNFDLSRPIKAEEAINQITGVVTNGLFAKRPADKLFVATSSGVRTVNR